MDNLDFIDREIELLKQCLMINKTHDTLNYKLKHLLQIKTELEAWYEIKNLYLKGYFSRIALPMESHEKVKKALEVEEYGSNESI